MSAKILISGVSNSGKTSLLKTLKDAVVLSRDGKKFPFPMYHTNLKDFSNIEECIEEMYEFIERYKEKLGDYPKTIAIDSVSRLATEIENNCDNTFNGFEVWKNVSQQMNTLRLAIEDMTNIANVVIIAHSITGDDGKTTEVSKGSFAKAGGFLSTVDYALFTQVKKNTYTVVHKNHTMARTLLTELPEQQEASEFNLQDYIDLINKETVDSSKWQLQ